MSDSPQVAAPSRVTGETPVPHSGRWQIPLLGPGLLLLAVGIARRAASYHPVTFEDELRRVALLRDTGADE